jgi:mRNA-degrading endonuclease YafQ of YafQ-DinJ toxin-antitoxin module
MWEIERTSGFKRDFKPEARERHRINLNGSWIAVLRFLAVDTLLP